MQRPRVHPRHLLLPIRHPVAVRIRVAYKYPKELLSAARHCGGLAVTAAMDEMSFLEPVHVGDTITCQQKVTDMYDKKGGALWFVVSETSMKDQSGKLVAKGTGITVVRNPDAGKK